jgi:hypothetical protein
MYDLFIVRDQDGLVVLYAQNLTTSQVLTIVVQARTVYHDQPLTVHYQKH